LIDDFATLSRSNLPSPSVRAFKPKFDVRELKDSYELYGELPGIEQKDLDIQWSDAQTLAIKGRVETRSEQGQKPAETPAVPEVDEEEEDSDYHKPSVEDDFTDDETSTTASKPSEKPAEEAKQVQKPAEETARYWLSERSVGQFSRTFTFPGRVDQDAVKASLKNGILSVVVPKAKIPEPRRINIE